jgi:ferritin-like metal-binding protein YciE
VHSAIVIATLPEAAKLLRRTLDEEKATDAALSKLAEARLRMLTTCGGAVLQGGPFVRNRAHAMERNAQEMLERQIASHGDRQYTDLKARLREHLAETKQQLGRLEKILGDLDSVGGSSAGGSKQK